MAEALLVEDYPNMSPAMQNMMCSLENPTIEEIVVFVLYILVVETGFIPFPSDPVQGDESCRYNARRLRCLSATPSNWKNRDGVYSIYFVLSPFPEVKCKLVCVPIGTYFIANMFSSCTDRSFEKSINPAEYVALYPMQVTFKRLKSLSRHFKDEVVIPIRTMILNQVHQTTVGLFALPVEVLLKIIHYLQVGDFLTWTSTCKYFFDTFAYDELIWKHYCNLKFCKPHVLADKETYREYYRRKINFRNRVSSFRLTQIPRNFCYNLD